jgi:hypothetical protein
MDVLSLLQSIIGEKYGKIKTVCKGGSWLYTPEGKVKICIPRIITSNKGQPLDELTSYDLYDEDVLFIETDKGIIVKEGMKYVFYTHNAYRIAWKR